jgi:hypothetical protein
MEDSLCFYGLLHHVDLYVDKDASQEHAPSIFKVEVDHEDGGSMFLRDAGVHVQRYTVPQR